ncbi:RNA pyrophosphohydrolase [Ectothiorhodospira lacustris]|uniref:RNA pyrophosphohydrolase n=1 Tax=Ectothiorhodospira lacustris TaxID=2899127 RepID=UPI001EE9684D|nr:RNA pyrophosphohydrolase [Ectothiorhodospira lacustris]MCG5510629.1 RNA pyrophosphohydrolase [Ectothiorhodospira lacustris]MCG5521321.1 RNA pyrophosphohydrolase [Ectothiorhodospira lacustris]
MIDCDGYRPNVGIILCNRDRRLFWAKRIGQQAWQFPQGGIRRDESPTEAMYRELAEETGLEPADVEVVGYTQDWLRYRLPKHLIRRRPGPLCIGQKQVWFLVRLVGDDGRVRLDAAPHPEFDAWRWVDYWYPMREVVFFKRHVYRQALRELAPLLFQEDVPSYPAERRYRPRRL